MKSVIMKCDYRKALCRGVKAIGCKLILSGNTFISDSEKK